MTALRQRIEPIRSPKYLAAAKGQPCALRFVGVCNGNPETTVACHVHDQSFGMGRKAHDISTIDGCSSCHMFLDHGWVGKISRTVLLEHLIRGLQETWVNRVERGIIFVPIAVERPSTPKAPKPKAPSRPIQSRGFDTSIKRPMQSRNNFQRTP